MDIDDRERYSLEFPDIFAFTQNFDQNIPHISQGTWPHKNKYDAPKQINQYGHSPHQRVLRSVNLFKS